MITINRTTVMQTMIDEVAAAPSGFSVSIMCSPGNLMISVELAP